MRAFQTSLLRTIRDSLGRFIAIAAIVALGCGFYGGLRMTGPDMRISADRFYDGTYLYDIRLLSTLGYSDSQIAEVAAVEGVEAVMPAKSTDVMGQINEEQYAMRVSTLPLNALNASTCVDGCNVESANASYMNRLVLAEGRWPKSPGECVISADRVAGVAIEMGDTLEVLYGSQDLDGVLATRKFTIVGTAHASSFVSSITMGATSLGSGSIQQFAYVAEDDFSEDCPYTELFVRVEGAADFQSDSQEYKDWVAEVKDRLDAMAPRLAQGRLDGIRSEAQDELDEKSAEYEDERADALDKLDEAADELESAEAELADALDQIASGQSDIDSGWAQWNAGNAQLQQQKQQVQSQLENARTELEANQKNIDAAEKELEAGRAAAEALPAQKSELESQLAQAQDGLSQAQAGLEQIEAGLQQVEAGIADLQAQMSALSEDDPAYAALAAQLSALEQQQAGLQEQQAQTQEQVAQLSAAIPQLQEGIAQVDAGIAQFEAAKTELASGKAQLEAGWKEYHRQQANANTQIANAEAQLNASRQQLLDSQAQIDSSQQEVDEGLEELASGKEEYASERKKALDELADAAQIIADAQKDIDELELPDIYVLDRTKNYGVASQVADSERIDNIAAVFPFIFFLVAALVALTTMTRMVEEERALIGTFKALGYSKARITGRYLIYAAVASVVGAVIGLAILSQVLPFTISKAYAIIYNIPDYPLPLPFDWKLGLLAGGLGVGITLLATLAAAVATLRETPAALMLPRAPKAGKRILLERIKPLWQRVSFSWKVTLRNLFRYKKRLTMTVIGIAGCTALLLTGWGLHDSIWDIIDKQFGPVVNYNIIVKMDSDATKEELSAVSNYMVAEGETEDITRVYSANMQVSSASHDAMGVEVVVPSDPSAFARLLTMKDRTTQLHISFDGGVVLTEKLASSLGVGIGDEFLLYEQDEIGNALGSGFPLQVTGIMENYIGNWAYIGQEVFADATGIHPSFSTLYGRCTEDLDKRALFTDGLHDMEGVQTVSYNDETIDSYRTMLSSVDMIVVVLVVSAAALAFIVLYNLTNINITERRREIASLKVLGFTKAEVHAYIFREIAILTVIGACLGLILGIFIEGFVVVTAEVDYVMFGRDIHGSSFAISFAMTLLFAAFVMLFMRKKLQDVDMIESLKSVE